MDKDSLSSQLRRLAKKHKLRQARLRIDGKRLTWLERDQVPKGLTFEKPPAFEAFTLTTDGKELTTSQPLTWRSSEHEEWEMFLEAEAEIIRRFGDDIQKIRSWKTSVEEEWTKLHTKLEEHHAGARKVLNAWGFLTRLSLPEMNASEKSSLEEYEANRARYQLDQMKLGTLREQQRLHVLESLSAKYPERLILHNESTLLWGRLVAPDTAEGIETSFKVLCKFFGVGPLLQQTTLMGLLYYRQKIADQIEELLPLECQRVACEKLQTLIVRGQSPLRRKAERAERVKRLSNRRALWEYVEELREAHTLKETYHLIAKEWEELGIDPRYGSWESFRSAYYQQKG